MSITMPMATSGSSTGWHGAGGVSVSVLVWVGKAVTGYLARGRCFIIHIIRNTTRAPVSVGCEALGDGMQPMAAASAARRVAPYALVSAPRDAGDRWHHVRSAICACKAADTAGSATCSHHHDDTFTAHALEMGVDGGVNASATAAERRCTVAGFTFSVAC